MSEHVRGRPATVTGGFGEAWTRHELDFARARPFPSTAKGWRHFQQGRDEIDHLVVCGLGLPILGAI
jgi:hypothetical protein